MAHSKPLKLPKHLEPYRDEIAEFEKDLEENLRLQKQSPELYEIITRQHQEIEEYAANRIKQFQHELALRRVQGIKKRKLDKANKERSIKANRKNLENLRNSPTAKAKQSIYDKVYHLEKRGKLKKRHGFIGIGKTLKNVRDEILEDPDFKKRVSIDDASLIRGWYRWKKRKP